MTRLVLDTNVLIGDAYNRESASHRIVSSCLGGRLVPVVSQALLDEYEHVLPRAIRVPGWRARFEGFLALAMRVEPAVIPPVVAEDPSDDILFATAIAGGAIAIVSNDRPVLRVGEYRGVRVVRPGDFVGEADGRVARRENRIESTSEVEGCSR